MRCTGMAGMTDHGAGPGDVLGSDAPGPTADWPDGLADDGLDTDAIGEESETSGATTSGSAPTSTLRCTADSPSTAGCSRLDRIAGSPEEPSPAGPLPTAGGVTGGLGEAITIGEEPETSGATSAGSLSLPLSI